MGKKMFSNRQLRRLILPLIVEQLFGMLVGMVDTVMVSSAGEAAISGVSIVNDVNNLVINLLAALAGGGAVVVSQYLGKGDHKQTNASASQLVMISTLIALIVGVFCVLGYKVILQALFGQVDADVMASAQVYFWITALSFPFLGLYNSSAALFRSMNETKSTMFVSFVMNLVNVVGNYICVFIFHMGAAGVAWPTLVSRIVAAVLMFGMALDVRRQITVKIKEIFTWQKDNLRKILTIAIPNGIENGLFQLGKVMITMIVATYGTSQIAANGTTNSFVTLCYTTALAMNLAIVTVVGQCVGANDYPQAKYYIKKMIAITWLLNIVDNIIVFVVSPYALMMYTLTPQTMKIAETILTMECVAVALLHAPAFTLPSALRAAGDAKYTMIVGVCTMFVARVGCAYLLGTVFHLGVVGTRMAMYIDWMVRIVFFLIRYYNGKWMNFRLVGEMNE